MTFREQAALIAFREILRDQSVQAVHPHPAHTPEALAAGAVRFADALVAALGQRAPSVCGAAPSASGPAKQPGPYSEKP